MSRRGAFFSEFYLAGRPAQGYLERMQSKLTTKAAVSRSSAVKRLFLLLLTIAFLATTLGLPAEAARHRRHRTASAAKKIPQPDRFAEIVMDAQTGYILSQQNPDKRLYPASTTKLMTLYLTFEAIQNGSLSKSQRLPISANAEYQEPSKLGLKAGYTIKAEDAILGVVTRSANDAAVVLGEAVGGSENRFARMMTFKAQALGMRGTHFANASGLFNADNYSTVRDMAILAQALMRDFPREYHYFSTPSFTYNGLVSFNHNKLMKTYPGMDGLKTGYVNASGYNLVASAVHDGKRLIGVVFGGKSPNQRNKTMADLLDAGFAAASDPRVVSMIQKRAQMAKDSLPRRRPGVVPAPAGAAPAAPNQIALASPAIRPVAAMEEGDTSLGTDNAPANTLPPPANSLPLAKPAAPTPAPGAIAAPAAPVTPVAAAPAVKAPVVASPAVVSAPAAPAPAAPALAATSLPAAAGLTAAQRPAAAPGAIAAPARTATPAVKPATAAATPAAVASRVSGTWAVQVGAYASHDAGMAALKHAAARLPKKVAGKSTYVIAPLMTNRGVIYRARLAGFDQNQANKACKVLRGSCLVLALQ